MVLIVTQPDAGSERLRELHAALKRRLHPENTSLAIVSNRPMAEAHVTEQAENIQMTFRYFAAMPALSEMNETNLPEALVEVGRRLAERLGMLAQISVYVPTDTRRLLAVDKHRRT